MSFKKFFFSTAITYLSCINFTGYAGFAAETMVCTQQREISIENLKVLDTIVSFDGLSECVAAIVHIKKQFSPSAICIEFEDGHSIICSGPQKFYLAGDKKWIRADSLKKHDALLCRDQYTAKVKLVAFPVGAYCFYELTVKDTHVFYVGKQNILAHNGIPFAFFIGWTIGEGIEFGASIVLGALGLFGIKLIKDKDQKSKMSSDIQINSYTLGTGGPKKDNEDGEKFWEKLKERSDKIGRSSRFGKIFRDPLTGLWWAKDLAQHGGSFYKVFKENSRGFEWLFDAAKNGTEILNKHKGPTGTFIPYKEVIFKT